MRNIKIFLTYLLIVGVLSSSLTSCMTTKTNAGQYRESRESTYTYAKGKQFWLFWGILPLSRTNVNTPGDGNCQIITRFNFWDFVVSSLTAGLISSYTIKVKAKRQKEQPILQAQNSVSKSSEITNE